MTTETLKAPLRAVETNDPAVRILSFDLVQISGFTEREWDAFMDATMLRLRNEALVYQRDTEAAAKRTRDAEASAKRLTTRRANEAKAKAAAPAPGQGEGAGNAG